MSNLEILGERVRGRRLELSMSQAELAIRAGYSSRSSINKVEKGIVDIPQSKIKLLAEILSVSEAWLMGYDVPMERSERKTAATDSASDPPKDYRTFISYRNSDEARGVIENVTSKSKEVWELCEKICQLDEVDVGKADGFVSGLLAADKYKPKTHRKRIAARDGGIMDVEFTDEEWEALKSAPLITELRSDES